jgi:hypothetical protein
MNAERVSCISESGERQQKVGVVGVGLALI